MFYIEMLARPFKRYYRTWSKKCTGRIFFFHCFTYCKFGNFREIFIFASSVKRHICHVKKSRLRYDLPSSDRDKEFSVFREGFIFAKLRIREVSRK